MKNEVFNLSSMSLLNYDMFKSRVATLDEYFGPKTPTRFNRLDNKIKVDTNWDMNLVVGNEIIIHGYRLIDPTTTAKIYNDMFIKEFTTALIKRQWGQNLIKFSGIQLPSGIEFDGQKMYDDAVEEINSIKESMLTNYSDPIDFMIG